MDFPDDVATNVFRVENVTDIHWSQWSHVATQTLSITQTPLADQLAANIAVRELRERYAHTLHEVGENNIWLFHISGTPTEEFDDVLESHGYSEILRGCLEVTDPELFGSATTAVVNLEDSSEIESSSSQIALGSKALYRRAMKALSAGLCHHFVSGEGDRWRSLGLSTSIDMDSMGTKQNFDRSFESTTKLVRFESSWNVAGCLTVSPKLSEIGRLCQVATMRGPELQAGTHIMLLPSGTNAKYRGRFHTVSSDFIQDLKSRSTEVLISQGLSVSPEAAWVFVEIDLNCETEESSLMLWPSDYVLCRVDISDRNSETAGSEALEDIDPMARAESWYVGRATRAAKVDIIQKEIDLQAQQQLVQQQLAQQEASNLDVSSEIASPAFREILAPQDISGIYPTPPDGLLSQTPASNIHQEASPRFATTGRAGDPSGYSDAANENLFEDMEMDLVGEADFNFFDEPGTEEADIDSLALDRKPGDVVLDTGPTNCPAESQVVDHDQKLTEKTGPEPGIATDGEHLSLNVTSEKENGYPSRTSATHDFHKPEDPNYHLLKSHASEVNVRGSFNPLSLVKSDFRGKYTNEGRFGHIPLQTELVSQSRTKHEIFRIGTPLDGTESSDSESEEALTEKQTNGPLGYDINKDLQELNVMYKENISRHLSPESSKDTDDHANLTILPVEFLFPTADPKPKVDFFRSLGFPKATRTSISVASTFIQISQLIADQPQWTSISPSTSSKASLPAPRQLESVVSSVFSSARSCHLKDLLISSAEQVEKLDSPAISIQRIGTMTDVSSSAMPFWEELGLSPRSGSKDVNAYCIFPMKEYLVRPVKTFLEMVKGAYQVCNLGKHTLDKQHSPYPHSLVPIPSKEMLHDIEASAKFLKYLISLRLTGGNTVIYILNIWDDSKIPDICKYFLGLFFVYRKGFERDFRNPNDLVLQIVPASMVFSSQELILPSPTDYKQLAFQVYDRCGPTGRDGQGPFVCAPALCLAKPTPNTIDFKLTANYMDSGDVLHLAYKWETGQQWLTASWTNKSGIIQWNASYWLSEDEDTGTSFRQIALAMLDTTRDIVQSQRAPFQLCVVKDGCYEDFELQVWNEITASDMRVSLVEIDPEPSLMLFSPRNSNYFPSLLDLPISPENTPYAGTGGLSPDVSTHISTPGGTVVTSMLENDPEARLIDITDEAWSLITDKPILNRSQEPGLALPLSVGYLIKRAGTQNEDGLLLMQINIIRHYEPQQVPTKELLVTYRNLALLAKIRNVIDSVKGMLPIHVANVRNAHAALCRTMYYGG